VQNPDARSADSILRRSLRRLPLFRALPALQQAREEIRELRQKIRDLTADLNRATQLVAQREVALRSATSGDLQLLAAPLFDEQRLVQFARARAASYRTAHPFPHFVEDGLFDPAILERVAAEFEAMDRGGWHHTDASHERKWSTDDARRLGPFTSALIGQLNGGHFVSVLEEVTGITGLVPDPHLRGGGLHEIRQGGLLGVHADFNVHPRLKLYRRLNLLIYLNRDWQESWGGALELWDREGRQCVHAIPPLFNRTVLFDTSNFSYHGHPHPLACPPERSRRSVALYYYSLDCPAEADRESHGTLFLSDRTPL
jgi:2-oxoglutarate-Fe(II)-dependent oxygenase superfamily protein